MARAHDPCSFCREPRAGSAGGFPMCSTHLDRVRAIAHDAGVHLMTTTATATRRFADKPCAKCRRTFTPSGPRSTECKRDDCDQVAAASSNGHAEPSVQAAAAREAPSPAPKPKPRRRPRVKRRAPRRIVAARPNAKPEPTAIDAHAVIEHFGLDYNLGNVVRFVLEHDDGDARKNLEIARDYLDRAIAKLED